MNLLHDDYLTVREVADIFRITQRTIYSWIRNGALNAVQLGGSWRIPKSQFEGRTGNTEPCELREEKADE